MSSRSPPESHSERRKRPCGRGAPFPRPHGLTLPATAAGGASANHRPAALHRVDGSAARNRSAAHEPEQVLAGHAVAPQDIGLAVSIEVPDSCNAPAEICYRGEYGTA